jgi:pimeloyl-ACP methyl ester carboxylesterase
MPAARLFAQRRAVFAPDLPGYGPSEKPAAALTLTGPIEHFVRLLVDAPREPLALMPVVARDYFGFGIPGPWRRSRMRWRTACSTRSIRLRSPSS